MNALAKTALLLVIVLVSLSAYLRLAHSGIGCSDWPGCYGRIGEPPSASRPVDSEDAYQRLLEEVEQPMAWTTPLHRLVASVLGLLVLFLNVQAARLKRDRLISVVLLVLTVFLATLGLRSGSLHNPAVVMGNLAGGFLMLGLLGWMVFRADGPAETSTRSPLLGTLTFVALVLLSAQILLGGLTSANFGATACRTLPDCHGSWLPGPALLTAFDLSREHEVTDQGIAIGGEERTAIHKTHRLGALLALAAVLVAGLFALRTGGGFRNVAIIILVLVAVEFSMGIAAILTGLPIGLAVAHNWLAALLLLAVLKLLALNQTTQQPL